MLPNIINDMFMKHTHSHNYNTRRITYETLHYKTTTRQNTLVHFGLKFLRTIIAKNQFEDCTSLNVLKRP